nr:hypothetical protein BaRGS_020152 [Batillaria attramentaria]
MSESSAEPDVQDLRTTSARDRNVIPEARLPQAATLGRSSNENILVPDGDGEILERRTRPGLGEDDDVLTPGREKTISETLSKLTDAGGKSGYHGADHGSCLIAIIFEAVKVPDDTLERLEDQDPDLHGRENEIWEQLLDMMALDFLPMDDDEEEDEEEDEDDEEYDDDYYDDYYDDYDYDCEEGTECDDDTASANDFSVISFSPMMT